MINEKVYEVAEAVGNDDCVHPTSCRRIVESYVKSTTNDLSLLKALRAAWQTRSEKEWESVAPETHALIKAAIAQAEAA